MRGKQVEDHQKRKQMLLPRQFHGHEACHPWGMGNASEKCAEADDRHQGYLRRVHEVSSEEP